MLDILSHDPFQKPLDSFEAFTERAMFGSCLACPDKGRLIEEDNECWDNFAALMKRNQLSPLATALDLATNKGWKIFPACLEDGAKKSYLSAKHAPGSLNWGMSDDPKQLRKNFDNPRWRDKVGVGVPTGEINGVFVVEADTPKGHDVDGIANLRRLEREHGRLPSTLMARSPTGSVHRYFNYPDGVRVKGSTSEIGKGVDVKSDGGMVIAPTTLRPGVGYYEWLNDAQIADAPQWLLELVRDDNAPSRDGLSSEYDPNDPFQQFNLPKVEEVAAAVAVIPNDDTVDREQWVAIGHALKAACPGDEGLEIFKEWSARWTGGDYDEEHTINAWKGFKPDRTGVAKLFKLANEADPNWRLRIAEVETSDESKEPTTEKAWPVLSPQALHGLAGEIVRTIEPHTESDPAAILIQFLISFGNVIGRGPYYQTESDRHFTNLYAVLVGRSSKSRKGTSAGRIRAVMNGVDEEWTERCIQSGLSSGEGLIWAIRDEVRAFNKKGEEIVEITAVKDKRLLLDEREFAQALTVMRREGNTVSRVTRDAWDSRPLTSLTKNAKGGVRRPHISIVGHITRDELRQLLDATSMANGFANRFLFVCVRRSKELPHGGNLSTSAINELSKKISDIVSPLTVHAVSEGRISAEKKDNVVPFKKQKRKDKFDNQGDSFQEFSKQQSNGMVEIRMNAKAHDLWKRMYHDLSSERLGMLGSICGRAEAQTLRLALIYALLDGKDEIEPVHLQAALAVWRYCEDSARYIFGDSVGGAFADELFRLLRENGGMSRTAISKAFAHNVKHEKISDALNVLRDHGLVRCEMRTPSQTGKSAGGRKVEFWVPV
jgi:bifunctional DNA primase/polymerase-like protein/primase-like protein/uncharacterized protein DUF3987